MALRPANAAAGRRARLAGRQCELYCRCEFMHDRPPLLHLDSLLLCCISSVTHQTVRLRHSQQYGLPKELENWPQDHLTTTDSPGAPPDNVHFVPLLTRSAC